VTGFVFITRTKIKLYIHTHIHACVVEWVHVCQSRIVRIKGARFQDCQNSVNYLQFSSLSPLLKIEVFIFL
jgi:hypothetical protein